MSPGGLDWKLSFPFWLPLRPCVKTLILLVKKHTVSHAGKGTLPSGQTCAFYLSVDVGLEEKEKNKNQTCALAFKSKLVTVGGGGTENVGSSLFLFHPSRGKKFLPFEGSVITFTERQFYWTFIPSRAGSPPLALWSFGWKVYKTL